ncbi:uncharacterized protein [Macrobrachium rosenbergii]|uniref:uncharacterized protein n=1 Tax=Macrobrachium rosenbergii TaxID=79674 RepID=UPI0034D56BD0
MVVKLCLGGKIVNIMSAYAPQAGCDEAEKVAFLEEMDRQLSEIPAEEGLIIGGDMNGHVGRTREGTERVHGGWGVGERNDEGEGVVDCAVLFDLAIVNNWKEVKKALKKMKNGKATGPDGVPPEVWKSLGEEGIDILWDLAKRICSQKKTTKE